MNILVVDNMNDNLRSAIQVLSGHNVYTCTTYREALFNLTQGQSEEPWHLGSEEFKGMSEAYGKAEKEGKLPFHWDVLLCGLFMSLGQANGLEYRGDDKHIGWALALKAIRLGVKYVAIVTNVNDQHHPVGAVMNDMENHVYHIDGAKVYFTNRVDKIGITGTESVCPECKGKKEYDMGNCFRCQNTGKIFSAYGKDWTGAFKYLLKAK